jgi:hypothetical protein
VYKRTINENMSSEYRTVNELDGGHLQLFRLQRHPLEKRTKLCNSEIFKYHHRLVDFRDLIVLSACEVLKSPKSHIAFDLGQRLKVSSHKVSLSVFVRKIYNLRILAAKQLSDKGIIP